MTAYTYPKRHVAPDHPTLFALAPDPEPDRHPEQSEGQRHPEQSEGPLNPLDLVAPRQRPPWQHESPHPKPAPPIEETVEPPIEETAEPSAPFVYDITTLVIVEVRSDIPMTDQAAVAVAWTAIEDPEAWTIAKVEAGYGYARLVHFQEKI